MAAPAAAGRGVGRAAAKTRRAAGGGWLAARPGSGITSGPARPGSRICAVTLDTQRRHVDPPAFGRRLEREVGHLHAFGALYQIPGERHALGGTTTASVIPPETSLTSIPGERA